jgi:hypothetical protein
MHGSTDKGYDDYGSKVDKYYVGMKKGKKKKGKIGAKLKQALGIDLSKKRNCNMYD